jgi:hypothetical protein
MHKTGVERDFFLMLTWLLYLSGKLTSLYLSTSLSELKVHGVPKIMPHFPNLVQHKINSFGRSYLETASVCVCVCVCVCERERDRMKGELDR